MMTLEEVLSHPRIKWLVEQVRLLYPTEIFICGGLASRGYTEHDIDIGFYLKDQDHSALEKFLDGLCEEKLKPPHTLAYRLRFPDLPYKIDFTDHDYYEQRYVRKKIEIEG